jgi:hypothetical protein
VPAEVIEELTHHADEARPRTQDEWMVLGADGTARLSLRGMGAAPNQELQATWALDPSGRYLFLYQHQSQAVNCFSLLLFTENKETRLKLTHGPLSDPAGRMVYTFRR